MTRHGSSDLLPPHGLFEAHLTVRDLDRAIAFYRDLLGLELAHVVPERQVAFVWIGGPGRAMLGLWAGSAAPNVMRLHLAFGLALEAVLGSPAALRRSGVEPLDCHGQPTTEPSLIGWMPAASVFFHDPDGHLLEHLAMLPHRPHPEAGVVPYRAWLARWTDEGPTSAGPPGTRGSGAR
jgi:lactoylglutathione lyase